MQIFNVGALELVFILLLAFIVLGPQRAVKAAGEVGRWIKDFTSSQFWKDLLATSREIQDLPRKIMDDVEIQQTIGALDKTTDELNETLRQSQAALDEDLLVINQKMDTRQNLASGSTEQDDSEAD